MSRKDAPILVVGAGSIGERHIRNLLALGYTNINICRQTNFPLRTISGEQARILTEWKDVEMLHPQIAFITSPTSFHLEQALACARLGAHLFIEKPLSHSLDVSGLQQLRKSLTQYNLHVQVGYMMRYHPLLKVVRQAVIDKRFGELISFHSHWGEYLPDWHPWEDYRTSYAARKDLGGGATLTLSHDLDVAMWITGSPLKAYQIIKSYKNNLEIDVEGTSEVLMAFQDGAIGQVHLNFVQRNPERRYEYRFDKATMLVDFFQNSLVTWEGKKKSKQVLPEFDRNDLFFDQTRSFMKALEKPSQEFNEAQLKTSETILAICSEQPLP